MQATLTTLDDTFVDSSGDDLVDRLLRFPIVPAPSKILGRLAVALVIAAAPAIARTAQQTDFGAHVRVLNSLTPRSSVATLMPASGSEEYVSPPLDPTTGLALKSFDWGGHRWSNDSGQTWNLNVPYAIGLGATKLRFELHDTPDDRGLGDSSTQRRAEMSMGNKLDRFFNDRDYWHAFTFIAHADCIACLTKGGTIMQMHWPSKGNPAFAFRLVKYGGGYGFRITTRGDQESNVKRYTGPLVGDVPHDVVYHFRLNGAAGALDVWLDGQQVLSLSGVPIGSLTEDGYSFRVGAYYGSLGGTRVEQEYGNIAAFPASDDLSSRIASPPPW